MAKPKHARRLYCTNCSRLDFYYLRFFIYRVVNTFLNYYLKYYGMITRVLKKENTFLIFKTPKPHVICLILYSLILICRGKHRRKYKTPFKSYTTNN